MADDRFEYEPLFSGNTPDTQKLACRFAGFDFGAPLWVSRFILAHFQQSQFADQEPSTRMLFSSYYDDQRNDLYV